MITNALCLLIGLWIGGAAGVLAMALCNASGMASRAEEERFAKIHEADMEFLTRWDQPQRDADRRQDFGGRWYYPERRAKW